MKPITTSTLLLVIVSLSRPLFAQNPVVTLSGNTFYRGDAPSSYTISCPTGTSAGVSALTKIANVSLLDPASVQYGIGVIFPWPSASSATPTLTGTLPTSYTQTVMGGNVIYNAGVLAGTAYCNAVPSINTTTTAFTLTLNGITRDEIAPLRDRLTWALKARSVKLPQLGTTEQNTLPPQQAGNMVFNTDQQKLAVHNGTAWQYVGSGTPGTSSFQNEKMFKTTGTTLWTVPTNVTLIVAEVWGGGSGGPIVTSNGGPVLHGGGAGGYARGFMTLTPGNTLTLTIGLGGTGGLVALTPGTDGGASSVYRDMTNGIGALGGTLSGVGGLPYGTDAGFGIQGGHASPGTISYSQKTTNQFIELTKYGDGGTAYGAQPGGFGEQSGGDYNSVIKQGGFPGGGGGCGSSSGGAGGQGMIVIHW